MHSIEIRYRILERAEDCKNIQKLARVINGNYAHIFVLVKAMAKAKLLVVAKDRRESRITLTAEGRRLLDTLTSIKPYFSILSTLK